MNKYQVSTIISIVILITGIYIYKDANIIIEKTHDTPYVEQKNNHTVGYENGKKVFDIQINKVRQNTYQHVLYAKNIQHGIVYNHDGKKVITHLKSQKIHQVTKNTTKHTTKIKKYPKSRKILQH